MIKAYCVINRFLSEENRQTINAACEKYGYDMTYFNTAEEADGKVSDGEVIYCTNAKVLSQMKGLKWCQSISAGVDHFVKSGVFESGKVLLTNSSGAYGRVISEHIIMVTLMMLRRMPEYLRITSEREWRMHLKIRSIAGSKIAILGTGDIGSTTASKFKALGASRVIGFNRSGRKPDAFDAVYRMSEFTEHIKDIDVVAICLPGTPDTVGIMNADRIAALPEKAILVNTGRGSEVDQDALIDALNEGRIAGAALDVVTPEPLPKDHPLWEARNCLITPHCSGDYGLQYTIDTSVDFFCENLRRYACGEELIKLVDPHVGY